MKSGAIEGSTSDLRSFGESDDGMARDNNDGDDDEVGDER